jgi:hypothetical protein
MSSSKFSGRKAMQKWNKAVAIVIILILFFVPTLIALKYVTLSMLFSHFVDTVSDLTGINHYLIKAATVLLFIPFVLGISFLLSINRTRRRIGTVILSSMFIIYNLGLYYFTKDIHFSFSQGKVLKWYALTPDGVKYFDRPGVEPVYGITLKPVTPRVIRNLKLLERGEFKPVDPTNTPFFNPITGEPQVWYYRYPDKTFDFFDKPGYHPITGEALKPVSKEIYFEWKEQIESNKSPEKTRTGDANRITGNTKGTSTGTAPVKENIQNNFISTINSGISVSQSKPNVALVIKMNNKESSNSGDMFSNLVKADNVYLLKNYFKDTFKGKGYFDRIYSGETTLLMQSRVFSQIDYLILGNLSYSFRKGAAIHKELVSCDLNLVYKIIDKKGSVIKSDVVSAIGPGFSEELALRRGLEILAEKYSNILSKIL